MRDRHPQHDDAVRDPWSPRTADPDANTVVPLQREPPPQWIQRAARIPMTAELELEVDVLLVSVQVEDISTRGIFVRGDTVMKVDTEVEFDLPNPAGPPLRLAGRIVWNRTNRDGVTDGMGIRFHPLPEPVQRRLEALVSTLESEYEEPGLAYTPPDFSLIEE